jgi:hypothetical protein
MMAGFFCEVRLLPSSYGIPRANPDSLDRYWCSGSAPSSSLLPSPDEDS